VRSTLGNHLIDESFFALNHRERHLTSPWCNAQMQRLRDNVFIEAMNLHKAFIDASAKTASSQFRSIDASVFPEEACRTLKKIVYYQIFGRLCFWSSRVFQRLFASVEKMLGAFTSSSLGWLIIDEAGQALPQAAVGALMRTKEQ